MFGISTMKRSVLLLAATAIAVALPSQAFSAAAVDAPITPGSTSSGVTTTPPAPKASTTPYGIDISHPQCGAIPDITPAFAIIGVNGGKASTQNPCFAQQFAWANQSSGSPEQPTASVYINTGNPALEATWWPSSNTTKSGVKISNPKGTCNHKAGVACAYVYGYSMALDDAQSYIGGTDPASLMWWLDVETSNTWSSKDLAANAASITGMAVYLKSIGAPVGLYSTPYQWKLIAGTTPSTSSLSKLPSWLAGAKSATDAAARCGGTALTSGGRISMVQWINSAGTLDYNYSCHQLSTTPTPKISGTAKVGKKLSTAAGTWSPKPTLKYTWKANGKTISGATKSYHTVVKSEVGKTLTVTVTGSKKGYNTVAMVSSATKKVAK